MKTSTALVFLILGAYCPLAPALSVGRFTANLLAKGKALIAGGFQRVLPAAVLASAELYDPSTGTFTATGSITKARAQRRPTLLPDGRVLVAGNSTDLSAGIYDRDTGTVGTSANPVARPFPSFRSNTAHGRVLIAAQPTAQIDDPLQAHSLRRVRISVRYPWIHQRACCRMLGSC